MSRTELRNVHLLVIAALAVACLPNLAEARETTAREKANAKRPNVIILLTDDQGYGDLSCHGNPVLKTPNFDRLHDESVRLADFHVAPMCTPTRGQLLTGLDALHSGASSVCAGRSFVRRGTAMMPEIFAANGYRTALFGKWHLGDSYPNLPEWRGFQDAVYHLGWGITSMADLWENDYFDGRFRSRGKLKQHPGYCTDVWFKLAKDWIEARAAKQEPFFLYLPTNAPHGPLWAPANSKQPYVGRGPAAFFGMIANIDENLGRLDRLLRETGQWENTILIFLNDNGGTAGVKLFNAGMRGHKTEYYEGGHRAACFIRWPGGGLRSPGDVASLTEVQDLLPTLIDLCQLKKPAQARFDGTSLAGALRDANDALPDRTLVVQYGQRPEKWDSAVMWKKWRLVKGKELYDLAGDFGQTANVAEKHADVVNKLRKHYETWWSGVEPKLNDLSPISLGAAEENPVTLSAADWANVYCDNMKDLRQGRALNGPWHVLVEQDGDYEIELRRWPREADAAMTAGVAEFRAVEGTLPPGKPLPIAKVRLKLGDSDESKKVSATDKGIVFELPLKAGTQTTMQGWCYDAGGQELCGAYFAYVRRK